LICSPGTKVAAISDVKVCGEVVGRVTLSKEGICRHGDGLKCLYSK